MLPAQTLRLCEERVCLWASREDQIEMTPPSAAMEVVTSEPKSRGFSGYEKRAFASEKRPPEETLSAVVHLSATGGLSIKMGT